MTKIPILFKIMEERKISAKKLSDDTGISTGNISDWKSGRSMPSGAKLQVLSKYFDVSTDYLLGHEESIRQNQSDNTPLAGLSENARRIVELFDELTPTQQGEIIGRAALLAELNEAEYRKDSVG